METKAVVPHRKYFYLVWGALFLVYLPVLIDLVQNWYSDPNYSHGFLVPLISGYLLWRKRVELSKIRLSYNT